MLDPNGYLSRYLSLFFIHVDSFARHASSHHIPYDYKSAHPRSSHSVISKIMKMHWNAAGTHPAADPACLEPVRPHRRPKGSLHY